MSQASEYGRNVSDLYSQQGQAYANAAANKSAIWGSTVAKLGDFAANTVQVYSAQKQDKRLKDLFEQASQEYQAGQSGIVSEESGRRIAEAIAREKAAGTYQGPEQRMGDVISPIPIPHGVNAGPNTVVGEAIEGNIPQSGMPRTTPQGPPVVSAASFVGPQKPPRPSPFPTLGELINVVGPERAIKIADGLKGLQTLTDPTKAVQAKAVALRDFMRGYDALSPQMRAEHWGEIRGAVLKSGLPLQPQDIPEQPDETWFKAQVNYGQAPAAPASPVQVKTTGPNGREATTFVTPKEGVTIEGPPPPEITPYQRESLDTQKATAAASQANTAADNARADAQLKVAQARLALAIKTANKPAIAKESGGLVDAVIANPVLWGQLTPTAKQTIAPELQKRGFTAFQKPPSATVENRLASAQAVTQTGNDIIAQLNDPQVRAMLGPAMGRVNSVREFIGNPPPELSDLAASIESFALANMGVHGMRSVQGADEIKQLLDRKHTPDSLIKTIQGLNRFSQHFLENEAPNRLPAASTPAAAPASGGLSYQDYLNSKKK